MLNTRHRSESRGRSQRLKKQQDPCVKIAFGCFLHFHSFMFCFSSCLELAVCFYKAPGVFIANLADLTYSVAATGSPDIRQMVETLTFTFTFRALSRCHCPKRLTISKKH